MPKKTSHYYPGLDVFRVLAFVIVTVTHLIQVEAKYAGDTLLFPQMAYGINGVDLFFVLSGYMMGRLYINRPDEHRPAPGRYIVDRISRIYPVYWAVTAILVLVNIVRPGSVFSRREDAPDLLASITLWPTDAYPLHLMAWALENMMYFYLVVVIILFLPRRYLVPSLAVWTGIILAIYYSSLWRSSEEMKLIGHPLTLEFIVGILAALLPRPPKSWAKIMIFVSILILAIPIVWFAQEGVNIRSLKPMPRVLILTPPIVLMVYGLGAWVQDRPSEKWFSLPGMARGGFALFLTHILTLSVIGLIWHRFAMPGPWDNLIMLPLMVVASMIAAMFVERYFETPIANFIRGTYRKRFPKNL